MDIPAWSQGIAAIIGVPSVLVAAITGCMQIRMMRRDRYPVFEPNGPAIWIIEYRNEPFAVGFSIDVRNSTHKAFVLETVSIRDPEDTVLIYPRTRQGEKYRPLDIQLDCPPGVTTFVLHAIGPNLTKTDCLSVTLVFSSKSRDIRFKDRAINVAITKFKSKANSPRRASVS